jgi:predicted signal transduction protein with EAL and GGDEF domain
MGNQDSVPRYPDDRSHGDRQRQCISRTVTGSRLWPQAWNSGSRLALEVTEGVDLDMQAEVLSCVADLRTIGVEMWLDDFGSGFAGLSLLRAIEFHTVKVDRKFLHDCSNQRGLTMLQDMVSLIRNRGNTILVGGVETAAQMSLFRDLRIDRVQGFHLGMTVSAELLRAAKLAWGCAGPLNLNGCPIGRREQCGKPAASSEGEIHTKSHAAAISLSVLTTRE